MSEAPLARVGTVGYPEAKRLQAALAERGVTLVLRGDPDSCNSCTPVVELYVSEADAPRLAEFLSEEKRRELDGLDFDPALAEEVFDSEKATARCPACGTEFSTQLSECPDCGLCFGGAP